MGPTEDSVRGPQAFAAWLDRNLDTHDYDAAGEAEYRLLCGEVRMACTYGMLLCLSRDARIAYLLGDLLGMAGSEGARILGVTPAAYRQRLARARRTMRGIIADRCGLVRAANPCRCSRQIQSSLDAGILDRGRLPLAIHHGADGPIATGTLEQAARQLDLAEAIAEVYRSDPTFEAPTEVWRRLQQACPDLLGTPA